MKRMLANLTPLSIGAAPLGAIGLLILLTGCAKDEIVRRQLDRVGPVLELARSDADPMDSLQHSVGRAH